MLEYTNLKRKNPNNIINIIKTIPLKRYFTYAEIKTMERNNTFFKNLKSYKKLLQFIAILNTS